SNDDFTLSLLTNEEVLAMHREGSQVKELSDMNGILAVTSVNSRTGETYLAVFNRNNDDAPYSYNLESDLGLAGKHKVMTPWDGAKVGKVKELSGTLRPHACVLYKISK
ncbi:MAG: hypothetical protein IK009_07665, partial [Bacteroidales bacterium]|nr:hypothetical protein [Bacteroidales bacterium]